MTTAASARKPTAWTNEILLAPVTLPLRLPLVHVLKGRDAVLRLESRLIAFSERCGQSGAMQDLSFFLSKPGALPRTPYLLLLSESDDLDPNNPNLDDLLGVLLIFEFRLVGLGTGAFATNDRSGRSTLIARPEDRARVAELACRTLLERGAQMILMSFRDVRDAGEERRAGLLRAPETGRSRAVWTSRKRTIPGYLPLANSFDETLAKVGQRTRSNLRYYRRRAEQRLGCTFHPQIEVTRKELLAFNRECMYTVSPEIAGWRYDALKELSNPMFMGIKDGEGRWLSMLGGRRYHDRSEIFWQLNRDGYGADSIGTVMRSYCIEHEIGLGSKRLYIEGGTPHPIRFSFVPEELTDLVVMRRTVAAKAMRAIARKHISGDNELSLMLRETDLAWAAC